MANVPTDDKPDSTGWLPAQNAQGDFRLRRKPWWTNDYRHKAARGESADVSDSFAGRPLATASLALGIAGIFLFGLYAIVPLLAVGVGTLSIRRATAAGQAPSRMATVGRTLGLVEVCAFVTMMALFFILD